MGELKAGDVLVVALGWRFVHVAGFSRSCPHRQEVAGALRHDWSSRLFYNKFLPDHARRLGARNWDRRRVSWSDHKHKVDIPKAELPKVSKFARENCASCSATARQRTLPEPRLRALSFDNCKLVTS